MLTEKLTSIANAIREKSGTNELLTLDAMPTAIAALSTGGGDSSIPEEAYVFSGDCGNLFRYGNWHWFLESFKDKITTSDITNATYMFSNCQNQTSLPFDINFKAGTKVNMSSMFGSCYRLSTFGKLINFAPSNVNNMFNNVRRMKELPEMINIDMSGVQNSTDTQAAMFQGCYSLRRVSEEFLKQFYSKTSTYYSANISSMFAQCYALDEVRGLRITTGNLNSGIFHNTFGACFRLKEIIFATNDDGTAIKTNLAAQTLDLSNMGYASQVYNITDWSNYSGITNETLITDDSTYQLYKNHIDSWTTDIAYSRYNYNSAVNTINSLPDTLEYSTAQGKPNTIIFRGNMGSATDGGAISNLTEEQIAVATAKGWTVSIS